METRRDLESSYLVFFADADTDGNLEREHDQGGANRRPYGCHQNSCNLCVCVCVCVCVCTYTHKYTLYEIHSIRSFVHAYIEIDR